MATLRERLEQADAFVVAAELVTSRGLLSADSGRALQARARELAANPRIDVLSITDNPGGHAMLAPDTLGHDLLSLGQDVVIHLACKDWNRNALESRGWKLGSEGFRNVLCMSGDYPVTGHRGHAAPVFDIDSVGLIELLADMNAGLLPDERRPGPELGRTDFFLGCVVTNHKRHEREVIPQYLKLRKKAAAGARFVINQIGYDTRKDDELLRWIRRDALPLAALANVYVLSPTAARAFHRGAIPGVVVTDELLELVERRAASPDRGRAFFLDLAARHVAVARGLGFAGVYLGGHVPPAAFDEVLAAADGYAADWVALARGIQFPVDAEFYAFARDPETGLSSDALDPTYVESRRRRRSDLRVPVTYRLSRRVHRAAFAEDAPLFTAGRAVYRAIERAPRPIGRVAHAVEQAAKVPLFSCKDCGDCSLPEIAYVCPESMCAKNQRNGPCGGTRDGLCEVYDSECIWSQAYERLKAYGEDGAMLDGPVVVKDNALAGTSAWANAFLGRDHHARPAGRTGR
ncbi:MAG TPA: methylenetetrahydrofolate reductase C-terminal domain-containing protein [Gaiella sp.]|nr:methylenetetrahydrofolate reductase C-terminal domain-containing protein [Gaiella sp.]